MPRCPPPAQKCVGGGGKIYAHKYNYKSIYTTPKLNLYKPYMRFGFRDPVEMTAVYLDPLCGSMLARGRIDFVLSERGIYKLTLGLGFGLRV